MIFISFIPYRAVKVQVPVRVFFRQGCKGLGQNQLPFLPPFHPADMDDGIPFFFLPGPGRFPIRYLGHHVGDVYDPVGQELFCLLYEAGHGNLVYVRLPRFFPLQGRQFPDLVVHGIMDHDRYRYLSPGKDIGHHDAVEFVTDDTVRPDGIPVFPQCFRQFFCFIGVNLVLCGTVEPFIDFSLQFVEKGDFDFSQSQVQGMHPFPERVKGVYPRFVVPHGPDLMPPVAERVGHGYEHLFRTGNIGDGPYSEAQ